MVTGQVKDSRGRFVKGHPQLVPSVRRGITGFNTGGRPKTVAGEVRDALQIAADAMPEIIIAMIERAQSPSTPANVRQAAAEYLCDRIYGRANQPLSNRDGTALRSFTFMLPEGFTPSPYGLISNSNN